MSAGNPKDEYLDASNNARQYQTIRFGQLTVYLAFMGFIANLLFGDSSTVTNVVRTMLQVGGLLMTLLFWVHQERTMVYWNHFVNRAAELEVELGFKDSEAVQEAERCLRCYRVSMIAVN